MNTPHERPRAEELLRHAVFLRALARSLVGDAHGAEDLVQDTWAVALERPPETWAAPRAWLATVARRLAANARRAELRREAREELAARADVVAPDQSALEGLESSRSLADALLGLREPQRTVIFLRYDEGLGPRAIAARLDVPEKTVKARLSRALAELRLRLAAEPRAARNRARGLWILAYPRGGSALLSWAGSIAGGLVMKKLVLALAVLLAGVLVWTAARSELLPLRATRSRGATEGVLAERALDPRGTSVARAPEAAAPREALPPVGSQEPATVGELIVQVVWQADGSPVAGLCLDALCLDDPAPRRMEVHVLTDGQGYARFEGLAVGRVRLFAASGQATDAEVRAGETVQQRFELAASFTVAGRVVDPEGVGVVGARLWVHGPGVTQRHHPLATSGADGRFLLEGLGSSVYLGARSEVWSPSLEYEVAELPVGPSGAREAILALGPPGGAVQGRVLDPEGEPVRDASVLIGPRGGQIVDLPAGPRAYGARQVLLRTDAEGTFLHSGALPPGTHPVFVSARGHALWTGAVLVDAPGPARLEVRLERAVRIAGRVLDEDGAPVAGAEVLATHELGLEQRQDDFPPARTLSDGEGLFLLDWVAPGEQELLARVPGNDRLGRARARVHCAGGETREVELVLELGATIEGRVIDGEGRPLEGWTVRGESTGWVEIPEDGLTRMRSLNLQRSDHTDADGRFLLASLQAFELVMDQGLTLRAWPRGQSPFPARAEARGVQPGARDVVLVVQHPGESGARLRGRLLAADGSVPQDVRITVWREHGTSGSYVDFDRASGVFEHELAQPGSYDVRVLRGGNILVASGIQRIGAGQLADIGTLRIGEPGRVEVSLRGAPPAELEALRLTLTRARAADESLEAEGDRFRSRPLAPGAWILEVRGGPWFTPDREVEVRAGELARLELELVPALPVNLSFSLADPTAVWEWIEVEIRDGSGSSVHRGGPWPPARLVNGVLKLHQLSLPVGRYEAFARTDAGQRVAGAFEVHALGAARESLRFVLR